MANLNLSEFTEKLFVADADHTFIWDTAASISKRVSRNSWLNSGTLTSDAPVTISQTWNAVGQTFKALVVNAAGTSDANSASGSLLADFQLGAVSKVSVTKSGALQFGAVQANFDQYISRLANGVLGITLVGFNQNHVSLGYLGASASVGPGVTVSSGGAFAWSNSSTNSEAARDTFLFRDGAPNTLALRNGAAAQRFNVYNSYLNAGVDYERMGIGDIPAIAGNVGLYYARAGSGAAKGIYIWNDSNSSIVLSTNATNRWQILNTGHLHAWTDNQFDIGANGANRPRNVYAAGNVSGVTGLHSGGTSLITFSNSTSLTYAENGAYHVALQRNGNGILALLQSGGGWDRLQLGGTTDAFPAVARDGAGIKFTGAAAGSTAWIKVPPVAVSALPLAATAGAGARAFVNDASSPTFGSAVTGGGAVLVPVYSDGSAWNVG